MAKTITIALGERSIVVPQMTLGQIMRIDDALNQTSIKEIPAAILRIALERTTPPHKPEDIDTLECDLGEMRKAVTDILVMAGFRTAATAAPDGATAEAEKSEGV